MDDTISRAKAIDTISKLFVPIGGSFLEPDEKKLYDNGVDDALQEIKQLPPAQLAPDQNGDLWITVPDIDKVTCIYVQESKSKFCRIFYEER